MLVQYRIDPYLDLIDWKPIRLAKIAEQFQVLAAESASLTAAILRLLAASNFSKPRPCLLSAQQAYATTCAVEAVGNSRHSRLQV